jgi:hypothetical protein
VYARHEGVSTGRDFVFGHAEIARLLVRVGEGMSLRSASADLRDHVLRAHGATSRQANLAVNYLDAYAPAVLAALHPTTWPRVVVLDTTTLFTRVPREAPDDTGAARVGNRRAGTVMVALDGTARRPRPCLMAVAGAKDADSWRAFFGRLDEAPEVVVADLDAAIARAVRETWPNALLVPSRHHLAARIRERLVGDGIPERVRLEAPVATRRALPWTGERVRRYGPHPLHEAALGALRGEREWAAFTALVERHVPPDRLALRGWIATNEPLVRRGWLLRERLGPVPLSTGALEGAIGEWLAPLRRRAGRWQNARRLDLVLGLITLRARGDAREARYGALVRAAFAAFGNRSHDPAGAPDLGTETVAGRIRPVSWWRTFHDRVEPSLPRLVREADRRWRAQARADHLERVKERLAERYATEVDLRTRLDLPVPPSGRPKRAQPRRAASVAGRRLADYPDLVLEWAWDGNAGLDPATLPAGSRERVAWRCLLEPAHVWETRVSDRTYHGSGCPFHMGIRVHPAESLAAFYPWLGRRVASRAQRAPPRPGDPGVGPRGLVALPGRARVDDPGVPADPLGERLPRLLPSGGGDPLEGGQGNGPRGPRRRRAGEDHRAPAPRLERRPRLISMSLDICDTGASRPFTGRAESHSDKTGGRASATFSGSASARLAARSSSTPT